MKLRIVPKGSAMRWFKLGLHIFFEAPLSFMLVLLVYIQLVSMSSLLLNKLLPFLGLGRLTGLLGQHVLGLFFFPMLSLSFMVLVQSTLLEQADKWRRLLHILQYHGRSLLLLGLAYTGVLTLAALLTYKIDGGVFAHLYFAQTLPSQAALQSRPFQLAFLLGIGLQSVLSLAFVYAPALLWRGLPLPRALFYSVVTSYKNKWALMGYGLYWGAFFLAGVLLLLLVTDGLASSMQAAMAVGLSVWALINTAWFLTGLYLLCRESFEETPQEK